MRPRFAASLLAGAAFCIGTAAGAAPFAVQLGLDRLVLDTPQGFADAAAFGSPRLTEIAETHASASNRVLVFGITDADARLFSIGDALELRRYVLAATPRATERTRTSAAEFATLLADTTRELGPLPPATQPQDDYTKYLLGKQAGQSVLLAELQRNPRSMSILQGIMAPRPEGRENLPPVFRLSTTSLALIGGKPLYISVFSAYDGPADLAWIRAMTARWIEDLQRLNR